MGETLHSVVGKAKSTFWRNPDILEVTYWVPLDRVRKHPKSGANEIFHTMAPKTQKKANKYACKRLAKDNKGSVFQGSYCQGLKSKTPNIPSHLVLGKTGRL